MDEHNIPLSPQEISGGTTIQPQIEFTPLGIGSLFKRTWAVYKSRFWTLMGISVLIIIGSSYLSGSSIVFLVLVKRGIAFFSIIFIIGLTLTLWSMIALLFAIKEREQRIGIIDSFRKAWHKLPSYIWISILVGLCVLGGTILLIIPGIIFLVWFSFSEYVLVAEDIKRKQALARSKALVKGHWWKVFWILIIFEITQCVIFYLLDFIPVFKLAWGTIFAILIIPFGQTLFFLIYEDLKGIKEKLPGLSPERAKREREDFKVQK